MPYKKFLLTAAPLFLIIFIDGMGLGLIFPILNSLIMDPSSHFLAANYSPHTRNFIFGFIVSIFMLCWFFGSAVLGDLSDQIGRKKSLMICLLGNFVGYFISALGVTFSSLSLLLFGRIVAGFTSGSQSIAQAAIIDISDPQHKARNIGMILFATTLGFVFGPLIGGFFSDPRLLAWFTFSTPLYFAAVFSLINAGLLFFYFHETFTHIHKVSFKLHRAIEIILSAFKNHKVRDLSIIMLVMILGWSSFYSFISMFLLRRYGFTTTDVALFMALMSVGFSLGTGFLVQFFSKRFALKNVTAAGFIISALFMFITGSITHALVAWICIVPIGAALAMSYSSLLTMFSNQVDADSQGWVMGITGSIMALGFGIDGLIVGVLSTMSVVLPIFIAAFGVGLSAVMVYRWRNGFPPARE